jgi:type IV pilus assembly protein PilM
VETVRGFYLFSSRTGIDIGAGSIKVVRMASGRRPKLLSAALIELPLDQAAAPAISTNLRYLTAGKKIGRNNAATLMSGQLLTIRSFTMPKMPLSELNEAVRWESKKHVSFPLETAQIEYLITGEKLEGAVEKYDILLIAAEREKVLGHLAPFVEAKIAVSAVDANALALRNVLRLRKKPDDANTLIVDIGAGKTEIDIFKGGVLRFSRCLENGGLDMTRAVAEIGGLGLAEAETLKRSLNVLSTSDQDPVLDVIKTKLDGLLMEIRRSVEYYKSTFREKGVESTILTGGVSLMLGLKEYFAQSLEGSVDIEQAFNDLSERNASLEEFVPLAPRFSAAVGLVLRKP